MWRADSTRQHEETINAVRATAQEMVPYNLTGYLDEFSKALAGEIRTLLGEVGRLHEQKRTLQLCVNWNLSSFVLTVSLTYFIAKLDPFCICTVNMGREDNSSQTGKPLPMLLV